MTDDLDRDSALVARREQIVSEILAEYDQDYRLALAALAHRLAVCEGGGNVEAHTSTERR